MSDLLPCPFCGPGPTVNLVMQHNPLGGWLYEVACQGCSVTMPCDDSEAEAIADWNRRYSPAPQTESGLLATIDAIISNNVYVDNDGVAGISSAAEAVLDAVSSPGDSGNG